MLKVKTKCEKTSKAKKLMLKKDKNERKYKRGK